MKKLLVSKPQSYLLELRTAIEKAIILNQWIQLEHTTIIRKTKEFNQSL